MVEMMVAMVMVGVVLTAAFASATQSLRMQEVSRDYTRVAQILQSQLEDLRTLSWSDLEAIQTSTSGNPTQVSLDGEFQDAFGSRYRAWRMVHDRVESGVTLTDQKEIVVWVVWTDNNGSFNIKNASCWFSENGLHDYYYRSF